MKHVSAVNGLCEEIITSVLSDRTQAVLRRLSNGLVRGRPLAQSFHYDANLAQHVYRLTSENRYDIVHVESPFLAPYLDAVNPRNRPKTILSMHNIESLRLGRELACPSSSGRWLAIQCDRLLFESWEKRAVRQFDGVTAVSNVERTWIQRHAPTAIVELVPNGVDTKYFYARRASRGKPSLVFTGLMDHPPNVDAAIWFCDEILPGLRRKVPDLAFNIVGSKPHPKVSELKKRDGVQVTGEVPDTRPYLAESIVVVPLRSGGGTRLKILEAMAMNRPVVSTTLGAEGLDVVPGANIMIADTPDQFVKHVLFLLSSPEAGRGLGSAARGLVEERYDWSVCLDKLQGLYNRLLAGTIDEITRGEKAAPVTGQ
jgi:sugar transferase (PEP-CTERM/EpsH1 system associated)